MSREHLFTIFFFLVLAFLLHEAYRVFVPFISPFAWAGVLALAFFPLYRWMLIRVRSASLAALAMTALVTTVLIGPVATFGSVAIGQGQNFYETLRQKAESGEARVWFEQLSENRLGKIAVRFLPREMASSIDIGDLTIQGAQRGTQYLIAQLGGVARNIMTFLVDFFVMQIMLFFFFRDGRKLYFAFRDLLPMEREHKDAIFGRLYETLSAVVQGMVYTAILQGFAAGIAFWALSLPFWLFLGLASAVASFIPLGGAAIVWVPAMIYFFAQALWIRGVLMLLWGSLVISLVDNIVRPLFIGSRTNISTMFLLFGILGGVQAYGPIGVFVGPVLLATIVVVLRIYREEYAEGTSIDSAVQTIEPTPGPEQPTEPPLP